MPRLEGPLSPKKKSPWREISLFSITYCVGAEVFEMMRMPVPPPATPPGGVGLGNTCWNLFSVMTQSRISVLIGLSDVTLATRNSTPVPPLRIVKPWMMLAGIIPPA